MDNSLITEIPACPDSVSTPEARELFMDTCQDQIQNNRLTPEMLECVKGYCFTIQIGNIAEAEILKQPDSLAWHNLWTMAAQRQLEYSEVLGLTPLDRKNLGMT